jgi:RNase P subunit RPR2
LIFDITKRIQTILHAADEVTIANSDDELQMAVSEPNKITKKYDMKVSPSKTKVMGFCKLNSVVLVRKRTIPTERPQPVGKISANFS